MCVSHGETFLSDTKSYDSLFYEIIRATSDFIKLSEYGRHPMLAHVDRNTNMIPVNRSVNMKSRGDSSNNHHSRGSSITIHEFYNIKLICNHFKPALDEWQAAKNIKFSTPEQVMGKSFFINFIL
jgi:hypothetical protein